MSSQRKRSIDFPIQNRHRATFRRFSSNYAGRHEAPERSRCHPTSAENITATHAHMRGAPSVTRADAYLTAERARTIRIVLLALDSNVRPVPSSIRVRAS